MIAWPILGREAIMPLLINPLVRLLSKASPLPGKAVPQMKFRATKSGGLISPMSAIPGTYAIVDIERGLHSPDFRIDDNIYRDVLKHAVRTYFYQRAGFKKTAQTAGPIGRMLQAIWAVGRILKHGRGNPRTNGSRATPMLRISTVAGSTQGTSISIRVGRLAIS